MMMEKLTLYCVSTAQKRCKRSSLLYHVITMKGNNNKKLSCFREAVQCFWSRGHLRVAVMHLPTKFGADIFIQSGVMDSFS